MILRQATPQDLERVIAILNDGRTALAAQGLDQWQGGAPFAKIAEQDIADGTLWVAVNENDMPIGTVTYVYGGEADYSNITAGAWLTQSANCPAEGEATYPVLHRVAVKSDATRQGVATFLLTTCFARAQNEGFLSVRVDTHEGNTRMQHTFEKCGMTRCCEIEITNPFEPTKKRIGFEIVL